MWIPLCNFLLIATMFMKSHRSSVQKVGKSVAAQTVRKKWRDIHVQLVVNFHMRWWWVGHFSAAYWNPCNETHGFLRETTRNFKTSLGFAFCKDAHCLNNMFFFQSYGAVTEEDTSTDRCVDKLGQLGPPGFGPTGWEGQLLDKDQTQGRWPWGWWMICSEACSHRVL